jgi:uncharacterized protein (TIGR01777 family)
MNVFITGGTGFVGRRLAARLTEAGHDVLILSRSGPARPGGPARTSFLQGDPTRPGPWQEAVRGCDAAVNLAGTSIYSPWTRSNKRRILESRVAATRNLVEACDPAGPRPAVLVSASAVGYYGFRGDEDVDESALPGQDFLAGVTTAWEAEAIRAEAKGVRVVRGRFGLVLGGGGGMLGPLLPLYKAGLGGPLASGRQWMSWIHADDLAAALAFVLERPDLFGAVNMCAPNPVRNREFARTLGRVLRRPAFFRVPGFALRIALGEFAVALINGQRVLPRRLLDAGFAFRQPELGPALADILKP